MALYRAGWPLQRPSRRNNFVTHFLGLLARSKPLPLCSYHRCGVILSGAKDPRILLMSARIFAFERATPHTKTAMVGTANRRAVEQAALFTAYFANRANCCFMVISSAFLGQETVQASVRINGHHKNIFNIFAETGKKAVKCADALHRGMELHDFS